MCLNKPVQRLMFKLNKHAGPNRPEETLHKTALVTLLHGRDLTVFQQSFTLNFNLKIKIQSLEGSIL